MFNIYRKNIIQHSQKPFNQGLIKNHIGLQKQKKFINLLCGDSLKLQILFNDKKKIIIRHETKGCLLFLSSASIMSKYLSQQNKKNILLKINNFLEIKNNSLLQKNKEIEMLQKMMISFPERKKCILFPWESLKNILS